MRLIRNGTKTPLVTYHANFVAGSLEFVLQIEIDLALEELVEDIHVHVFNWTLDDENT